MTQQEILKQVEEVIEKGPFKDNWESLSRFTVPKWYKNAKFGIFIHWGVYSVPAFGNEWYPRGMYTKDSEVYKHHVKTYGDLKTFGYKDFIPMFKAEKFNAEEWVKLFKESGAKYIMPVAEHHDGFQMYDSELSKWNAKQMGPCRDIVGELKAECDKEGIVLTLSNHRAEHCWFLNGGRELECDINDPANEDFYWKQEDGGADTHNVQADPPSKEHCENWLARLCEMVDKYQPRIVYFDWFIHNIAFKPYIKKFAAYYYNRAKEWGIEVAINYKYFAYALGTAVFDVERGQLENIRPRLWQTDTAIAKNSWGYTENNDFKKPVEIVGDLVDIVSKNGCLLLNVGPKPDGSITDEEKNVLLSIGEWLKKNGEGIYDTTYWQQFGEGPTKIAEGAFSDTQRTPFTCKDIRFTYKGGVIYAFVMKYPTDGKITIDALRLLDKTVSGGNYIIKAISVLGENAEISFERTPENLSVQVNGDINTDYPVCLKIEID